MSEWKDIDEELKILSSKDGFNGYSEISSWLDGKIKKAEDETFKEILKIYSKICYMMLIPTSMNAPLKERLNFIERGRSAIPDDLIESEIILLESTYEVLQNSWLKARIAEILWLLKKPKNIEWIQTAIDSYLSILVTKQNWHKDVCICHERAFYLAAKFGQNPQITIDVEKMRRRKLDLILSDETPLDFTLLKMGQLLREYHLINDHENKLIDIYFENYKNLKETYIELADGYLKELVSLYKLLGNFEKIAEIIVLRVDLYEMKGDKDVKKPHVGAVLAQDSYEKALQILATLQRRYRTKFEYTKIEQKLYEKMKEATHLAVETMPSITEKVDIEDIIDCINHEISGKEFPIALHKFLFIKPFIKPEELRKTVIEKNKDKFLSNFFGEKHFSGDARVIKKTSAIGTDSLDENQLEEKMILECKTDADFWTRSALIEGFKILQREHSLRLEDFYHLTQFSPFIPEDRAKDIGRGLYYGYDGDFFTALHLLAPQIEHIIRYHLKNSCVQTTIIEDGVETELSLNALLKKEEAKKVFNEALIIELKSIFTHPSGFNIRNDVAHGLVSSNNYNQVGFFYAWYFLLRITFTHFCRNVQNLDDNDFSDSEKNPL